MVYLRVNLKVCEGCGNLWFRAQGGTEVYCAACSDKLRSFPTTRSRRRAGRPRKHTNFPSAEFLVGGAQ
jgi:LSD1 subclass zinc finger protein